MMNGEKSRDIKSPFGWKAGIEHQRAEKQKSFLQKHGKAVVLVCALIAGGYYLLSSNGFRSGGQEETAIRPTFTKSNLQPAGSYEASKQLIDYVHDTAFLVAKDINQGKFDFDSEAAKVFDLDIQILRENAGESIKYYNREFVRRKIGIEMDHKKLETTRGFFGLGSKSAGEKSKFGDGNFTYGMSKDEFIETCLAMKDREDYVKSCRAVVMMAAFPALDVTELDPKTSCEIYKVCN